MYVLLTPFGMCLLSLEQFYCFQSYSHVKQATHIDLPVPSFNTCTEPGRCSQAMLPQTCRRYHRPISPPQVPRNCPVPVLRLHRQRVRTASTNNASTTKTTEARTICRVTCTAVWTVAPGVRWDTPSRRCLSSSIPVPVRVASSAVATRTNHPPRPRNPPRSHRPTCPRFLRVTCRRRCPRCHRPFPTPATQGGRITVRTIQSTDHPRACDANFTAVSIATLGAKPDTATKIYWSSLSAVHVLVRSRVER